MRLHEVSLVNPRQNDWSGHSHGPWCQWGFALMKTGLCLWLQLALWKNWDRQQDGNSLQDQQHLGMGVLGLGMHGLASIGPHTDRLVLTCALSSASWLSETTWTGTASCEISCHSGSPMSFSKKARRPLAALGALEGSGKSSGWLCLTVIQDSISWSSLRKLNPCGLIHVQKWTKMGGGLLYSQMLQHFALGLCKILRLSLFLSNLAKSVQVAGVGDIPICFRHLMGLWCSWGPTIHDSKIFLKSFFLCGFHILHPHPTHLPVPSYSGAAVLLRKWYYCIHWLIF